MSEKYRIGDISKLLGIPVQTLRYYEEQGIIHPEKDEKSGYRYYDAWELNSLMDSLYYRSLDFSLKETEQILNEDNREEICRKYTEQEAKILHQIEEYKSKLEAISQKRQQMQTFMGDLNQFKECQCPGLLFFRHRLKDRFQSAEGVEDFNELKPGMKEWVERIPHIEPTFMIPKSSLQEDDKENLKYWWGWSMPIGEALQEGMEPSSTNEYLPSCHCVYTVFQAGEEGTFSSAFSGSAYQKVVDKGYVVNGNPIGRLILKEHDKGQYHRYFETWIPVEG